MSWFRHQYAIGSQNNYNYTSYQNLPKLLPIPDLNVALAVDNLVQAVSVIAPLLVTSVNSKPKPFKSKKKKYGFYR